MCVTEDKSIRLGDLSLEHLPSILDIEREAYPDPWSQGMFHQEIGKSISHFYLAFLEDTLVGYAGFWLLLDEAHVTKVTIAARFRGQGLGRSLMELLLERARQLGATTVRLEVRERNTAARTLYESQGFSPIRIRKGYYARSNESAIEMAMVFPEHVQAD